MGVRVAKGLEVKRDGGATILLGNAIANGNEILVDVHVLPGLYTMDASTENLAEHDMPEETVNSNIQSQGLDNELGAGAGEKRWPGWPGDNVFRILVPSQKVGSIIGRKGELIKRMCEESKARIKILDGPPNATERAVIISAKEEPDASVSPAMDALLRVHQRIVEGLDGEGTHALPNGGPHLPTRLLVGATHAGTLIGKQGTTIKSIQEASKSNVRIVEELPSAALKDDKVVEIQGEPEAVHKAVELVANILRKYLVDHSVLPIFEMHMSMQQPDPHMHHQHMEQHPPMEQQMHHRHMEQRMHHDMPPPEPWRHRHAPLNAGGPGHGPNPQFMPPRTQDNLYPPPDFPVEKPPHHGISRYGREAPPFGGHPSINQPPHVSSQVTHRMQIPLLYADAVIGSSGGNISYIRRTSGATISIQESRGVSGEMTVEINGSATQIQIAQQLIQNSMAEAGAPAPDLIPPADHGYGSYQAPGSMYNAGPPAHSGGGYPPVYGTNYGY